MNEYDDGGPAYPRPSSKDPQDCEHATAQQGMSLLQWYAGKAMAAIIQNDVLMQAIDRQAGSNSRLALADLAFQQAEAMVIVERERRNRVSVTLN
jgi:hypothetical protein